MVKILQREQKYFLARGKLLRFSDQYINSMDGAKEAVCIIYPFNIEKIFKDFYQEDRGYLRFIITDKGGDKTDFVTNDKDVIKTQGAILTSPSGELGKRNNQQSNNRSQYIVCAQ
jgi:hypothetical protein